MSSPGSLLLELVARCHGECRPAGQSKRAVQPCESPIVVKCHDGCETCGKNRPNKEFESVQAIGYQV